MTNPSYSIFPDHGSSASALDGLVRRHLSEIGAPTLVQVIAVHSGNGFAGTVDVQPLVHQQTSDGTTQPHGTIYGIPYFRLQGGACAIIVDPTEGDIGYIIVSGRDQSGAVAARGLASPGSFRQHSFSDSVYIGGYLNNAPLNYLRLSPEKIIANTPLMTVSQDLEVGNGATGSFLSQDGKKITVKAGVTVSIE